MEKEILLEMKNISKSYPGVKALNKVNLEVCSGEVHALLGENGAGKSTLMGILAGIQRPDEGEIIIDGTSVDICDVEAARRLGISIIHQELCLATNMTVAENIFLGREPVKGFGGRLNISEMIQKSQEVLDANGLEIQATDIVDNLSIAEQQMVEIAKSLAVDSKIIVMDEPTSSLTNKEVKKLFSAINQLKSKGVAIIYISHKMEEIFEICDRVTILRDGNYITSQNICDVDSDKLIKLMVGRDLGNFFERPSTKPGEVILEVKDLYSGTKVTGVSFELHKGEILGFYGLVGAGRSELMKAIFGIDKIRSGSISINGKSITKVTTEKMIKMGLALIPENRKVEGALLKQTVDFNTTICVLNKIYKKLKVNSKAQKQIVSDAIRNLSIKVSSPEQLVGNLSGGNQQKVIIAKWLATDPKILILDEPTKGIDVGAKQEIYHIMSNLIAQGVSIILISSEMNEIINMSTRVLTIYNGSITGDLSYEEITQESIIIHATGGKTNGKC